MNEEFSNVPSGEAPETGIKKAPVLPGADKSLKFSGDGRDLIFAALFILGTFFGVAWGLWGGLRLGFSIAHIAALIIGSIYFGKKGSRPGIFAALCGALSAVLALPFAITSNYIIRILSAFAATALEWIWFAALAGKRIPSGDLGLPALLWGSFSHGVKDMPAGIKGLLPSGNKKNQNAVKALAGILCAVPVLCVVIPLLAKSDEAFDALVSRIVSEPSELMLQLIATIIAAPFIIGFAVSLKYREKTVSDPKQHKGIDPVFLTAFFAVLSLCYILYLFSQLAYFFSAFSGILPEGYQFTYAAYARRGFFEMCIIAGINLTLIFVMVIFSRRKNGKLSVPLKIAGCFIGLFTLLLIAAAISKMVLYISSYGMTVLRVGTGVFMLIMAAVFITVILRCFTDKVKILQTALILSSLALILLGTVNINAVIAKYNYDAYISGKLGKIDTNYLYSLGEEGVPYLIKLAGTEKYYLKAKSALWDSTSTLYYNDSLIGGNEAYRFEEKIYPKFSQWGVSRSRAYNAIDALLKESPEFFDNMDMVWLTEENYGSSLFYEVPPLFTEAYDSTEISDTEKTVFTIPGTPEIPDASLTYGNASFICEPMSDEAINQRLENDKLSEFFVENRFCCADFEYNAAEDITSAKISFKSDWAKWVPFRTDDGRLDAKLENALMTLSVNVKGNVPASEKVIYLILSDFGVF